MMMAFCLALSITGCRSNKLQDNTEKVEQKETGEQEANTNQFGMGELKLTENESGESEKKTESQMISYQNGYICVVPYTYMVQEEQAKKNCLSYIDPEQKTKTILCNNPTCTHDSSSCIAYMTEWDVDHVGGDKDNIYYVKLEQDSELTKLVLYRIKLNTFEKEELTMLFQFTGGATGEIISPLIYDGYFYCQQEIYDSENEKTMKVIYRCKLEKDATTEKIYTLELDDDAGLGDGLLIGVQAEKEYIYFVLYNYDRVHNQSYTILVGLNLKEGDVWDRTLENDIWSVDIKNGKLYAVENQKLCEYTSSMEKERELASIDDKLVTEIMAEDDYLLLHITEENGRKIALYSYEGELLGEYSFEGLEWDFIGHDAKHVYFMKPYGEEIGQMMQIELEKIKAGTAEIEEIQG